LRGRTPDISRFQLSYTTCGCQKNSVFVQYLLKSFLVMV
jgi:hypothetical protein